jgi:hypothetical protein
MLSGAQAPAPAEPAAVAEAPREPSWSWRPDTALAAGVACLLLALLIGVLIGRAGRDRVPAAAAPQVLTVGAAPTATPAPGGAAAPAAFTSDWPAGKKGFTVQLQALPKDGTDAAAVAAAEQAATGAGASAVGALDSDAFSSLDPGRYVIYSGQFAAKQAATDALAGLKAKFPGAQVIAVSSTGGAAAGAAKTPTTAAQKKSAKAIQDLQNASPQDYQKKSAKLPRQITTPGKLPPKDNKPAGGGGKSQSFE